MASGSIQERVKQQAGRKALRGFTIAELLIVMVVVAILAGVVVVSYQGVTTAAREVQLKSDLKHAARELARLNLKMGAYPASGDTLARSNDTLLTYKKTSMGYCIGAVSASKPSLRFQIREDENIVTGECGLEVETIAGSSIGFADGTAASAQFDSPSGVAVDSSGVLYIADVNNHRIRKITPNGDVTTLAGSTYGFADGIGAAARFAYPTGIAVDTSGTLFVADQNNHRIRRVTQLGEVTTLAGSGTAGFAEGTGTAAQFNFPFGITVGATGVIYVADKDNNRIRKITPGGVVTTFAGSGVKSSGDGTGTAAQFNGPRGIVIDSSGTLFVTESSSSRIRKISSSGVVTKFAGSATGSGYVDGTGTNAKFNTPYHIAADTTGALYVADMGNQRIRKITQGGEVTTAAGTGTMGSDDAPAGTARFRTPQGVAVGADGAIYVADYGNHRIRVIR